MPGNTLTHTNIQHWIQAFHQAKRLENLSQHTLTFYKQQLNHFTSYLASQDIDTISGITPAVIRGFLEHHIDTGHNPGGLHAAYRVLRTWLLWYGREIDDPAWRNPITTIKPPKLSIEPMQPVSLDDVDAMLKTCQRNTFTGDRDRAVLLCLLDTGARAREFIALLTNQVNLITGQVSIEHGKGGKSRTVFLGQSSRRALRAYLKHRTDQDPALWVTDEGTPLMYAGLRWLIIRRAERAGVAPVPSPHDFRRAFALSMLRNGCDLVTLARLMGHSDYETLQRYLRQLPDDLRAAHVKASPVDRWRL